MSKNSKRVVVLKSQVWSSIDSSYIPMRPCRVTYKECQRNHAANTGGYAIDGCIEFMPGGAEGTARAYICAACNCHRNFHRKEVDFQVDCYEPSSANSSTGT